MDEVSTARQKKNDGKKMEKNIWRVRKIKFFRWRTFSREKVRNKIVELTTMSRCGSRLL